MLLASTGGLSKARLGRLRASLGLSEAIFAAPNNTMKFTDVPKLKVRVDRGMTHDGLGKYVRTRVKKARGSTADIVNILKGSGSPPS
jgi:myo-inositol-1-phosphate synthase